MEETYLLQISFKLLEKDKLTSWIERMKCYLERTSANLGIKEKTSLLNLKRKYQPPSPPPPTKKVQNCSHTSIQGKRKVSLETCSELLFRQRSLFGVSTACKYLSKTNPSLYFLGKKVTKHVFPLRSSVNSSWKYIGPWHILLDQLSDEFSFTFKQKEKHWRKQVMKGSSP